MTAASMFGVADFDREAQARIAVVRRAETFPELKTKILYFFVLKPVTAVLTSPFMINLACRRLHKKAVKLCDAASWFNGEYPAYFNAVAGESRVPSVKFLQRARSTQDENRLFIQVCEQTITLLNRVKRLPELMKAFEAARAGAVMYDEAIAKFLYIGDIARDGNEQMHKVRGLSVQLNHHLANYYSEKDDGFDPDLVAAADAALSRMKAKAEQK